MKMAKDGRFGGFYDSIARSSARTAGSCSLDAYPKINEDFYSRTLSGGVITIVSSVVMVLLFFTELLSVQVMFPALAKCFRFTLKYAPLTRKIATAHDPVPTNHARMHKLNSLSELPCSLSCSLSAVKRSCKRNALA
eukprot:Gb_08540 [translate_table: standard]